MLLLPLLATRPTPAGIASHSRGLNIAAREALFDDDFNNLHLGHYVWFLHNMSVSL